LASGLAAALGNVAMVAVAHQLDVSVEIQDKAIPLLGFAQVTLLAAIIGIGLAALCTRRARRPRHTFVVTTLALSALSMVPPAFVDADTATKVVLGLTHIVAAVIVIPAIAARLAD
jgi:peptidoglycan/LPS O-acetylase OafA/YrhL